MLCPLSSVTSTGPATPCAAARACPTTAGLTVSPCEAVSESGDNQVAGTVSDGLMTSVLGITQSGRVTMASGASVTSTLARHASHTPRRRPCLDGLGACIGTR